MQPFRWSNWPIARQQQGSRLPSRQRKWRGWQQESPEGRSQPWPSLINPPELKLSGREPSCMLVGTVVCVNASWHCCCCYKVGDLSLQEGLEVWGISSKQCTQHQTKCLVNLWWCAKKKSKQLLLRKIYLETQVHHIQGEIFLDDTITQCQTPRSKNVFNKSKYHIIWSCIVLNVVIQLFLN